jgi:hypothetical protein
MLIYVRHGLKTLLQVDGDFLASKNWYWRPFGNSPKIIGDLGGITHCLALY